MKPQSKKSLITFLSAHAQTRAYSERRPVSRWVAQAQKLHKAIESPKTDEAAILEVVVSLKNKERQRVLKVYQDEYNEV